MAMRLKTLISLANTRLRATHENATCIVTMHLRVDNFDDRSNVFTIDCGIRNHKPTTLVDHYLVFLFRPFCSGNIDVERHQLSPANTYYLQPCSTH